MNWLIDTFGAGPVALVLFLIGIYAAVQPFLTARDRRSWPRVKARVLDVPQRRTMMTATWAVEVEFRTPSGEMQKAIAPINITRTPVVPGDEIELMHHPKSPARTAVTPMQGASTGWMVAGLCLLAAIGLAGGL